MATAGKSAAGAAPVPAAVSRVGNRCPAASVSEATAASAPGGKLRLRDNVIADASSKRGICLLPPPAEASESCWWRRGETSGTGDPLEGPGGPVPASSSSLSRLRVMRLRGLGSVPLPGPPSPSSSAGASTITLGVATTPSTGAPSASAGSPGAPRAEEDAPGSSTPSNPRSLKRSASKDSPTFSGDGRQGAKQTESRHARQQIRRYVRTYTTVRTRERKKVKAGIENKIKE